MMEKTKMDEMNMIYLEMKNTVYDCKNLLEHDKEKPLVSQVNREILKINFDSMYKLLELSQMCWNESKK